jgi:hypothetical protein
MKSKCCNKRVLKSKEENICYCCGRVCDVVEEKNIRNYIAGGLDPSDRMREIDFEKQKEIPTEPQEWEDRFKKTLGGAVAPLHFVSGHAEKEVISFIRQEKEKFYQEGLKMMETEMLYKIIDNTRQELKDELVEWCEERKSSCLEEFDTAKDRYIRGCLEGMTDAFDEVINLIKNK